MTGNYYRKMENPHNLCTATRSKSISSIARAPPPSPHSTHANVVFYAQSTICFRTRSCANVRHLQNGARAHRSWKTIAWKNAWHVGKPATASHSEANGEHADSNIHNGTPHASMRVIFRVKPKLINSNKCDSQQTETRRHQSVAFLSGRALLNSAHMCGFRSGESGVVVVRWGRHDEKARYKSSAPSDAEDTEDAPNDPLTDAH